MPSDESCGNYAEVLAECVENSWRQNCHSEKFMDGSQKLFNF